MKIAVLGASGMLGSMLVDYLSRYYQVIGTVRDLNLMKQRKNVEYRQFDVLNRNSNLYGIVNDSDWIINAIGAIPQRFRIQSDEYFNQINTYFPKVLSLYDKPVIHVSTDCVFSGDRGVYTENDICDVSNIYGQSKYMGEIKSDHVFNIRCSLIGHEPIGCYSLLKWFLSKPKGAVVPGYINHLWNGVTTLHFAKICMAVIEEDYRLPNLQHLVPVDAVCKYELLRRFSECFNRNDIVVQPIEHEKKIDRRLATVNPDANRRLWELAGYCEIPTVEDMVRELAEYMNLKEKHAK